MRNFGSGTVLRYRLGPGTWRILILAALLCLLPLSAGSAHAAGNAASPARQAGSAAAHDWRSIYKHNVTHADLNGIACPTSRTCVVVGSGGTILTTSDGGATWRSRPSGTNNNLWAVTCLTSRACLAVGTGTILASADGGATWTSRPEGPGNNLLGVTCRTVRACLAVGVGIAMGSGGVLMTSADGGATWTGRLLHSAGLRGVTCRTSMACIAVGDGTILTSADGAATWPSHPQAYSSESISVVTCLRSGTCLAGTGNTILFSADGGVAWRNGSFFVSSDGGVTWHSNPNAGGASTITCTAVRCLSTEGGGNGNFGASTDGGATWHISYSELSPTARIPYLGTSLTGIACPTSGFCLAVGRYGTIVASTDGGTTWTFRSAPFSVCPGYANDPAWVAACK